MNLSVFPTSCIEGDVNSTSTRGITFNSDTRLALITIVSADIMATCRFFFKYYTEVERLSPRDIYVVQAGPSAELQTCYNQLIPRLNIVNLNRNIRIKPWDTLLRDRATTSNRKEEAGFGSGSNFSMGQWVQYAMSLQRELLFERNYTHTLIVELDEIVTPLIEKYPGGLLEYIRLNQHRRTIAPTAYEVQEAWSFERPFDWEAAPLLRQRSAMVLNCGLRKPILSRVPTHFTFAMHNMADPTYFACDPAKWGSNVDCLDTDLWLIHLKCADLASALSSPIFRLRPDLGANATTSEVNLRRRCINFEAWRARCELGPTLGSRDSPNGTRCKQPVRLTFGIPSPHPRTSILRIPQWVQDRI